MDDAKAFGVRLLELRHWRRLTLREATGLAGLSFSFWGQVERGQKVVNSRKTLEAMADALQVAPTELTEHPWAPRDVPGFRGPGYLGHRPLRIRSACPLMSPIGDRNTGVISLRHRDRTKALLACAFEHYLTGYGQLPDLAGADPWDVWWPVTGLNVPPSSSASTMSACRAAARTAPQKPAGWLPVRRQSTLV